MEAEGGTGVRWRSSPDVSPGSVATVAGGWCEGAFGAPGDTLLFARAPGISLVRKQKKKHWMSIDSNYIALWGAGLSTILALIRIWEVWSSRRRIEVSYSFGCPEDGNDIIIRNISDKALIVTYWELQFCKKKGLRWLPYRTINPWEPVHDICIDAYSTKNINFSGPDHFHWGYKALCGKRLYLKLHIAGRRRPVTYFVYQG